MLALQGAAETTDRLCLSLSVRLQYFNERKAAVMRT